MIRPSFIFVILILILYQNSAFALGILNHFDVFRAKKQVQPINEEVLSGIKDLEDRNKDHVKDNVNYINYVPEKIGRALVSGQATSYMWTTFKSKTDGRFFEGSDISSDKSDIGITYNAMLRLGAEVKSNDFGIKYGADFQLAIPNIRGSHFERKAAINRGSKIFASTLYGDFSVGYQEGVESIMKLDASNIVAGDESSNWTRHIKGILLENKNILGYSMYPLLFSPGLYSENVFRNNDNIPNMDSDRDFLNTLPIRLSYQSPNFMGLRFGVSYSPLGYNFSDFSEVFNKYLTVATKVKNGNTRGSEGLVLQHFDRGEDNVFFGTKYEHILSGGIAYNYNFNNSIRFGTSIVGEYARPRQYSNATYYDIYAEGYNLQGLSIGSTLNYNNLNFAAAYGYLGRSGFVKRYLTGQSLTRLKIYPMYEIPNTYYWDAALGYKYKSYYVSVMYFKSNRNRNVLEDISIGFEYNLLKEHSKMKCKLFGNYHYYKFSTAYLIDKVHYDDGKYGPGQVACNGTKKNAGDECRYSAEGLLLSPWWYKNGNSNGSNGDTTGDFDSLSVAEANIELRSKGRGNLLLVGIKLEF